VLAIANFSSTLQTSNATTRNERLFRREAETSARDACATQSQTILLQAPVKCASAQAESFCGLACVAVVSGQGFLDEECFNFFETHVFKVPRFRAASRETEISPANLPVLRHQHCALDDMIEFPNIPGKSMLEQTLARGLIEPADLFSITFC